MTFMKKPSVSHDDSLQSRPPFGGEDVRFGLGIEEFESYDLILDARTPREFDDDHLPGAVNLPVVGEEEYAQVGTLHVTDKHSAYVLGVERALANMSRQLKDVAAQYPKESRVLVYCFRGGKRSKLWGDTLGTVGYNVAVLKGGWKAYRRWVNERLAELPAEFNFKVLAGSTGCGKTRLLQALAAAGGQVLDLEGLAQHRGSLIGALPGVAQPSQKTFETLILSALRKMSPAKPVWIEAESKKIGRLQVPQELHRRMHTTTPIHISAPMQERVSLWQADYAHFASNPQGMVKRLEPIRALVGAAVFERWRELAVTGELRELFERVMVDHYDPCYQRSTRKSYGPSGDAPTLALTSLNPEALLETAGRLIRSTMFAAE
jgi:tRNA 2-selenouridine synthase